MIVTDIVYQGGGMIVTFDDGSTATVISKVIRGKLLMQGLTSKQAVALEVFNKAASASIDRDLRMAVGKGETVNETHETTNITTGGLNPPAITGLDNKKGTVYFTCPKELRVEVYKYTRKNKGKHTKKDGHQYSDRLGKRFRVLYQLPLGATEWTIDREWIKKTKKSSNRNFFKFGTVDKDNSRSGLTSETIATAVGKESKSDKVQAIMV